MLSFYSGTSLSGFFNLSWTSYTNAPSSHHPLFAPAGLVCNSAIVTLSMSSYPTQRLNQQETCSYLLKCARGFLVCPEAPTSQYSVLGSFIGRFSMHVTALVSLVLGAAYSASAMTLVHRDSVVARNATPIARSSSADFTGGHASFYSQNGFTGACGVIHPDSAFIAALRKSASSIERPLSMVSNCSLFTNDIGDTGI